MDNLAVLIWVLVAGIVANAVLLCGNLAATRALWEFYKSIKEHENV